MKLRKNTADLIATRENRLVLVVGLLSGLLNMANWFYYRDSLRSLPVSPNDYHYMLMGVRSFTAAFLFMMCFGIWLRQITWIKQIIGKTISLIFGLLIRTLYVDWFFEKYRWLSVSGLHDGTQMYNDRLREIGFFRGANSVDYMVLIVAMGLLLWIVCRYTTPIQKDDLP